MMLPDRQIRIDARALQGQFDAEGARAALIARVRRAAGPALRLAGGGMLVLASWTLIALTVWTLGGGQ